MAIQKIKSQAVGFSPQNIGKNLIINGAMNVSQKTSSSGAGTGGSGFHLADKWETTKTIYSKNTHRIVADAPSGYPFANSYEINRIGPDDDSTSNPNTTSFWTLSQKINGQDLQHLLKGTSNAKQLTLSFWSKFGGNDASNGVNYTVELVDLDNNRQISKRVETNTDWTRNVITFPADTTGAFDNDNNPSLQINWWLATGSNYNSGTLNESAWASTTDANRSSPSHLTLSRLNEARSFNLTGVQLEVGEVADPEFEVEPYQTTLRKCGGGITPSSDAPPIVNRNLLINGGMDIWQRSTSVTNITGGTEYRTVDRWELDIVDNFGTGAGTWTMARSTDVPTNYNEPNDNPSSEGFKYSTKIDMTATGDQVTGQGNNSNKNLVKLQQKIEGQNLQHISKGYSNAKPLTLSFWVKSTNASNFVVTFTDPTNNRKISKEYTINVASTWEKKTILIPADTVNNNFGTATIDNDNTSGFTVEFWLFAGLGYISGTLATSWGSHADADLAGGMLGSLTSTTDEWSITGVQLEVGDTASGFEFEPYETVLRKCQRYYVDVGDITLVTAAALDTDGGAGTNMGFIQIPFPTEMRANPSISIGSQALYRWTGSQPNQYVQQTTSLLGNGGYTINNKQCAIRFGTYANRTQGISFRCVATGITLESEL